MFAMKQEVWAQNAGPGHWNDPDMVRINMNISINCQKYF